MRDSICSVMLISGTCSGPEVGEGGGFLVASGRGGNRKSAAMNSAHMA